jgi:hypothetical protein
MGCRTKLKPLMYIVKLPELRTGPKVTIDIRNKEDILGGLFQAQLCKQTRGVDDGR